MIYIRNFHVLNNFLLIYVCKLHWNSERAKAKVSYDCMVLKSYSLFNFLRSTSVPFLSIETKHVKCFQEYFCSEELGYELIEGVTFIDFLTDISVGIERPRGERTSRHPDLLREHFEKSALVPASSVGSAYTYSVEQGRSYKSTYSDVLTVLERAFYVKTKETEVLRRGLGSSVVIGLLIGCYPTCIPPPRTDCTNTLQNAHPTLGIFSTSKEVVSRLAIHTPQCQCNCCRSCRTSFRTRLSQRVSSFLVTMGTY